MATLVLPLQDSPGENGDVLAQLDRRVEVGVVGVEHGDAPAHPPLVYPSPQHGLGRRQLAAVVDPAGLDGLGDHHRDDGVAGVVQHRDDVGQVVLALSVVRAEAAQGRGQHRPAKGVDGGAHLVDGPLLVGGVSLLDDARDTARRVTGPPGRNRWGRRAGS